MLLLLQLATRRERQIIQDNRQLFLSTMRDLRRLVQRMSPEGEFRSYEWRRLQREAPRMINDFVAGFTETLMPELVALEAPVQEFAQDYADLEETSFVPQTEQQVLENVFIDQSKLPLLAYLIYNGRLAKDLLNKFIRAVDVGAVERRPNAQDRQRRFASDDEEREGGACGEDRQLRKYRFDADQQHVGRRGVGADQPEFKDWVARSRAHQLGLECCP